MHQSIGQGEVQVATVPAELEGADVECEAIQLWFAGFEYAGEELACSPCAAMPVTQTASA
jgi:hypothetical protein